MRRLWVTGWALTLAGCGTAGSGAPQPAEQDLAEGVAARVGSEVVSLATVKRVARAQQVPPAVARDRAVRDALFAQAARDRLSPAAQRAAERGVLARTLLEQLRSQARAAGPPSDAEVAQMTERRWAELDRPVSVRTVHAVVLSDSKGDNAVARSAAERLAKAVTGVTEPEAFLKAARSVDVGSFGLRAEELPAVTADGRVVSTQPSAGEQHLDPRFAQAANAIERVGEQSPVVESDFGYHVILLVERVPARRVSLAERRKLLADEIMTQRAQRLHEALLDELRAKVEVSRSRAVDDLTSRVEVR